MGTNPRPVSASKFCTGKKIVLTINRLPFPGRGWPTPGVKFSDTISARQLRGRAGLIADQLTADIAAAGVKHGLVDANQLRFGYFTPTLFAISVEFYSV